jgi:hypothetical protein
VPNVDESIEALRHIADRRNDILAEVAGIDVIKDGVERRQVAMNVGQHRDTHQDRSRFRLPTEFAFAGLLLRTRRVLLAQLHHQAASRRLCSDEAWPDAWLTTSSAVRVVVVPPLVWPGLWVALGRVLPVLLASERGDVEIAPGGA